MILEKSLSCVTNNKSLNIKRFQWAVLEQFVVSKMLSVVRNDEFASGCVLKFIASAENLQCT